MDLLEREESLDRLHRLLERARQHVGSLVFIGGEAGIGKSALVRRFGTEVNRTARVLAGACDALSTPRPLGPLFDIAATTSGTFARLLREPPRRDDVFGAFLAELGREPALVVVEDAHWADEATLDLLRFLGRRIKPTRALLLVTYRDDEVGATHPLRVVMGELATSDTVQRLTLPPLSADAVRTLAAGSGLDAAALHGRTGGNPFFVTEAIAAGTDGIPPTVRDAVLARVARLSPSGGGALETAAVIGSPIEPWLAAVMVPDTVAVDECLAKGMLRVEGAALAFRHELVREAVLAEIPPHRLIVLHRHVLAALRAGPETSQNPARLAHHADAAGDREAVLEFAPRAARHAAALHAHREAGAQYARALRFADGLPDEQREPLLEARFMEAHLTGQISDAIATAEQLLDLNRRTGDRVKEADWLSWLSLVLIAAGRNAEADQASRAALDILDTYPLGPVHACVYYAEATLRMLNRDCAEAIVWGDRAVAAAEQCGDVEIQVRTLNTVGSARLVAGDEQRGRAELEQSLALAREAGLDPDVASALSNLGTALGEMYRFALAEQYLTEGIAYAAERDLDRWRWYMVAWLALTRMYQGRWSEAAELALSVLSTPSASAISQIMALVALGRTRARRGDPEVVDILDEALALAAPTGTLQRLAPVRAARAEAAWLAGDRDRTRMEALAALELAVRHEHRWHIGELTYWLWRAGEATTATPAAAEPFARQIAGDWAGAAASWDELGCPYEAARARADAEDEATLRHALISFERLGARPAVVTVTRRLHERGVRAIPRGPRQSTRDNPANLTRREVEVLELLCAGLSNSAIAERLFLSPKTVEHHISAIFAKLGATSRAEAIVRAKTLDVPG